MNQQLNLIVEGPTDALILQKVLPQNILSSVKFYSASGRISLASLGRNILVHEGGPVLLVYDADTLERDKANAENAVRLAALRQFAPVERFDVFSFIPSIEIIFFEEPSVLEEVIGKKLSDRIKIEGELIPQRALDKLLCDIIKLPLDKFVETKIVPQNSNILRQGKQLKELVADIEVLLQDDRQYALSGVPA